MKIEKYNNIIKLLREKGADFNEKYNEICEKVKKYSATQTEGFSVKVEGVFEDETLITSKTTDNFRILTRITIIEGKNETVFVVKDIKENETKKYVEAYYNLASIKTKKKSLIFTRKEIMDYSISKVNGNYILSTLNQKNALVGTILKEAYLTDKEVESIEDNIDYNKISNVGYV